MSAQPIDVPRLMSRRGFMRAAGGLAALGVTHGLMAEPAQAATCVGRVPLDQISIQLYTMRTAMDTDLDGTLAALHDIGYRRVEEAGFHGRTAAEFKAALDKAGLKATSTHKNIPYPFDAARWDQVVADAKTLGQTKIVEPLPLHLLPILVGGMAGLPANIPSALWADYAHTMNTAAEIAAAEGIKVGYHNHNPEFVPLADDLQGRCGYDILHQESDPALVHFEMDIYWVWAGDRDPVDFLEKYPHRFRQFHVKDMDESGAITAPGQGVIDFARVFTAGKANQDIAEFIIEQDNSADAGQVGAVESARLGYQLLRTISYPYVAPTCANTTGAAPAPGAGPGGAPSQPGSGAAGGGPDLPTTGGGLFGTAALLALGGALALRRRGQHVV